MVKAAFLILGMNIAYDLRTFFLRLNRRSLQFDNAQSFWEIDTICIVCLYFSIFACGNKITDLSKLIQINKLYIHRVISFPEPFTYGKIGNTI